MEKSYLIPDLPAQSFHQVEILIRRSRFITNIAHANSPEIARACIQSIRQSMPDATHHCTAFAAGPAGHTAFVGYNDDGEPHGTAGRPMLTVLLHSEIGEIVAIVTRYYGGVKLGTGGLVKAYQQSVQEGLLTLPTKLRVAETELFVVLAYSFVELFLRIAERFEVRIVSEDFAEKVTYHCSLPLAHKEAFCQAVRDTTSGSAKFDFF